jgi:hypothetical protein
MFSCAFRGDEKEWLTLARSPSHLGIWYAKDGTPGDKGSLRRVEVGYATALCSLTDQ